MSGTRPGLLLALLLTGLCRGHASAAEAQRTCGLRLADDRAETVYDVGLSTVSKAADSAGDALATLDAWYRWAAVYLYTRAGEFEVDVNIETRWFLVADSDLLPDQVAELALALGWRSRCTEANAFTARVYPGLYGDPSHADASSFFLPFSVAFRRALTPALAAQAGATVRTGYRRALMPRLGVSWDVTKRVKWEGLVPDARLSFAFTSGCSVYLGYAWENRDYALDTAAEQMTMESYRACLGLSLSICDQFRLILEAGQVFDRKISFRAGDPIEPDRADYVTLVFGVY